MLRAFKGLRAGNVTGEFMSGLITVAVFDDLAVACVARSKLEYAGIPCFLENEHMVSVNWLYSNALGGIRLQVPTAAAAEAEALLSEADANGPGDDSTDDYPEGWRALPAEPGANLYGCGEDAPDGDEALDESPPLCPRCRSAEVDTCSLRRPLGALSWLLGFPLPFAPRWKKCRRCAHHWR